MHATITLPDGTRHAIIGRTFTELVDEADRQGATHFRDFSGLMVRLPSTGWVWVF